MYQLPVGNVEKIRKARKGVKSALSEIGLEDCQGWLKVRPIAGNTTLSPKDLQNVQRVAELELETAFERAHALHLLNRCCFNI